jgi:hypothetical protein
MQREELAELAIFIERFVKENYFRDIENWQVSAFQKKLRDYELSEVKKAFEKHILNPKKKDFMPNPQNIASEIGGSEKQKSEGTYACGFKMAGIPCGRKYDFGFQRKDGSYSYLCEQHYEEVREKSDIELEMLRRAKEMSKQAKMAGMTNREYAEATGFVKSFEAIRQAADKKHKSK